MPDRTRSCHAGSPAPRNGRRGALRAGDRRRAERAARRATGCWPLRAALRLARRRPWRLRVADIPSGAAERETLALHWNREALLAGAGLYVQADGLEQAEALRLAGPLLARLEGALVLDAGECGISERAVGGARRAARAGCGGKRARRGSIIWAPRHDSWTARWTPWREQFRLDTPTMAAAGTVLRQHAAELDGEALHRAAWRVCREHARRSMEQSATRIEPKADWDDLVLPDGAAQILRQIALQLRHRTTVLERLGVRRQVRARPRRDRAVRRRQRHRQDDGRRGAGRTTLGLDLYRIDLAGVVSKYIGETEKNLQRRLRRGRGQRRDPAVRRGRRAVRQAQRGQGQPRPLRQHRGQLPAAAHGGVSRPGDPDHQPAARDRPGVPAPHPLHRPVPVPRRGAARAHLARRVPAGHADARIWTPTGSPASTSPAE